MTEQTKSSSKPWSGWPHVLPIPDRREQMVRYYGYYSNVSQVQRNETKDEIGACILESDKSSKEYRKSWARLIQKIYEVDSLSLPRLSLGCLHLVAKIRNTERKESVCPDDPQKRLMGLAKLLKTHPRRRPRTSTPEIPRIPAEKPPKRTQDLVLLQFRQ